MDSSFSAMKQQSITLRFTAGGSKFRWEPFLGLACRTLQGSWGHKSQVDKHFVKVALQRKLFPQGREDVWWPQHSLQDPQGVTDYIYDPDLTPNPCNPPPLQLSLVSCLPHRHVKYSQKLSQPHVKCRVWGRAFRSMQPFSSEPWFCSQLKPG